MPEALIEEIDWKREEIRNVAIGLIDVFRWTLPVIAQERWKTFESDAASAILVRNARIREVELGGPNFTLAFRGPRDVLIPIITESGVEWRHREPRFVYYVNIGHELDEKLAEASRRIIGEAQDRFDLLVLTDPLRLIFPREKFAHSRIIRGNVELHY